MSESLTSVRKASGYMHRCHRIKFLENKYLVLKCEGIKGVLLKYVKLLDWTTLKVFLKDQQLFKYIDMKLSDNEENIF